MFLLGCLFRILAEAEDKCMMRDEQRSGLLEPSHLQTPLKNLEQSSPVSKTSETPILKRQALHCFIRIDSLNNYT